MPARRLLVFAALVATAIAWGCEPKRDTAWVNPLDALEASLPQDPKDNNYILRRMEFGRLALMMGCDHRAKPRLMEAFEQLGAERDNLAAALTTEQLKYYRGETYERAMLATYMGIIEYRAGNYNDARILFSRALSADKAAVVKETTPRSYAEDFGLAYFWIGRVFAKIEDADQCAIALRKAAASVVEREAVAKELAADQKAAQDREKRHIEGETWAFQTFGDPKMPGLYIEGVVNLAETPTPADAALPALPGAAAENPVLGRAKDRAEFFTPAWQAQANTVLMIEVGTPPFKYLTGLQGERTEFGRPCVRPRSVRVYVDGHDAGEAFEVLDLWDQAATQDRISEKDAAQTGKAVAKTILKYMPYVGNVAGYWNVQGDMRYWTTLPGKVFAFAGKLAPGPHTVRLQMYDCCGLSLARWTNTFYGIRVPAEGETVVNLNPRCDGDNTLTPELADKALKAGARPVMMFD